MANLDQSSRLESQLSKDKGLIEGLKNFLNQNLYIILPATVISFNSDENIAICSIDNPLFEGLEIQAPLLQNFANLNLQTGQSVTLIQSVSDPLDPQGRNYFDKGNWSVLSAFDLQNVAISILNLTVALLSGGSINIGGTNGVVINESGLTIGGTNGVVITSSDITIGGRSWSNHSHLSGTLASPSGAVTGFTGGIL